LAKRRESDGFTDALMPAAPDPGTLPLFHPPGTFGESSQVRPAFGHPPFNQAVTRSVAWVRETSARSLDYVQLAYLADNYAPRIYFRSQGLRPYSTVTMSVYFHASETELEELGDDYILIEATGSRAESSTVGAHASLWSRKGALLATTEQLGWFK
jgi:acyl-CoA thioesterase